MLGEVQIPSRDLHDGFGANIGNYALEGNALG